MIYDFFLELIQIYKRFYRWCNEPRQKWIGLIILLLAFAFATYVTFH